MRFVKLTSLDGLEVAWVNLDQAAVIQRREDRTVVNFNHGLYAFAMETPDEILEKAGENY